MKMGFHKRTRVMCAGGRKAFRDRNKSLPGEGVFGSVRISMSL
jgi:hypothetical protein